MIHPELEAFVGCLKAIPPGATLDEDRRAWLAFCLEHNRPPPAEIFVRDQPLRLSDRVIPLRVYAPPAPGPQACVIYLHGGGWVLGDLDTQDTIAWGLAEGAEAVVISVEYRLSPEHPYPAAFDDGYAVLEDVYANAHDYGIDLARIALCGDSAGGNLSAAISLAARDRGGPAVAAQALVYPVMDTDTSRHSYFQNAHTVMLTRAEMEHYLNAYLGVSREYPDAYAMPLRAADFSNLPPAFVHTAEHDPLHDEGRLYYERLRAASNEASYRCAKGMPHSFLRARFEGPAVRAEFDAVCDFLRRMLST